MRQETLKCLSVLQPWAYLTLCGPKRIENRSWSTMHRGTVVIHTGLTKWTRPMEMAGLFQLDGRELLADQLRAVAGRAGTLPYGAIVGVASLMWCGRGRAEAVRVADEHCDVRISQEVFADPDDEVADAQGRMIMPSYWVWRQVAAFPRPIAYRGERGLFEIARSIVQPALDELNWRVAQVVG